ncbi:hypothetical protein PYCCODRAFT_1362095 [Trametes coccinea BRFM310]|uniref:Uncharacterized protein n=1 Tax=Trametes coccinea (strain BRFM310) TaxID=1353009 RepID=A0A1Y2IWK3_TRAC3|nr:hypothetical protein PYCCODRAFT_1362095 [Trametes coccinea BRFM310]
MGFFKRFLSLGSSKSKKNKKKQNTVHAKEAVDAEGRILPRELVPQDPDTSMNRLLRSSSTKFSVMSAIDYASLPPLPLPTGATPSTPSLSPSPSMLTVATTPGVQRTGTYVVKVHGRTTLSRTEFPRANPPPSPTKQRQAPEPKTPRQDRHDQYDDDDNDDNNDDAARGPRIKEVNFTPKDNSRIYALRQDPSVVSLLKMYDDQGCLDVHAFASTPPTPAPISTEFEGREPRPRTGSTLRQLLVEPQPAFMTNNTTEGDISWAERFLE